MNYVNKAIIIRDGEVKIDEEFNDTIEKNWYIIWDIEEIARNIGTEIIQNFKVEQKDEGYYAIEERVKWELKRIMKQLCRETEDYLDRNWEE